MLTMDASNGEIVDMFNLTNEQIGLLNADYYIKKNGNGETKIFKGEYQEIIFAADLLALACARDNIRVDTRREVGFVSNIPYRYYLKSQNRYLCKNDFGMKIWDKNEGKMVNGDVKDVTPFLRALRHQFERIEANIRSTSFGLENQARIEAEKQIPEVKEEEYENYDVFLENKNKRDVKIQEIIQNQVTAKLKQLQENPKDKELLLEAIHISEITEQLHFNYGNIARKYGLINDDPIVDYENFNRFGSDKIEKLLREPNDSERDGTSLNFVYSDFHNKPVIVPNDFEKDSVINKAKSGVKDILAYNVVQSTPELQSVFDIYKCKKGEESPYFYGDHELYDFINDVGLKKAQEVLERDYRNVSGQMTGYNYLKDMGYNFDYFEPDRFKKQLYEANKLSEANIWKYLSEREKENASQDENFDKNWLKAMGRDKSRNLFREGKRMYWIALQVYIQNPSRAEGNKFYNQYEYVDWNKYDLTKADVSEEKLNEYLSSHKNIIFALLGENSENYYDEKEQIGKSATLGLIIQALESGQDFRGVAIANDKQRYLRGIINGEIDDDLEFALRDWPTEWREALTKEEISLYYEYADDYVLLNSKGLAEYAQWKVDANNQKLAELFNEKVNRKSDLDFRICLISQNDEIKDWYRSGAEYVGHKQMQDYLLRFNATRDTNGQFANWHDALFWIPNITKLEVDDAKFLLADIKTMDENQEFIRLIPRYDKEADPFKGESIRSLRELKKRVLAIESNIDLSTFSDEVVSITSAPGFNLSALESISKQQKFKDLLDGKLDIEQPFQPSKRMFAGRDLTNILQEGLGSYRKKIKGTANSPKKLFSQLKKLIKGRTINDEEMTVNDLLENVPIDLEEEVILLLQEQNVNIEPIIEAQIHAKSDPEGWVCGNYTDCCMPFGEQNNTDYMFNPSTQYFTIKQGGRIIAQSVIVDGQDKRDGSDVVILDNIEVARNYKKLTPLIARAYQTFWTEYTSKPVKVGTGYSDLIPPGGILEKNNFSSKTPLHYSDATGSRIYDLPKIKGVESADQIVSFANLTERDAELIAKMEEKTYPEEMKQGKDHILDIIKKQRELEVPGAASSFIVRKGNEPAGYLLVLPEKSEVNPDEHVAHIHDMAVLPKFQGTNIAKKMIQRMLDVASSYNVSIEMEARASTSYALLMNKRIQRWIESNGFSITTNEKIPEYLGGEDFYFIRLENNEME